MNGTLILSRNTDAEKRAVEDALLARAVEAGATVWVTGHLYHLAEDCSLWQDIARLPGPLVVASWLHARPAEALMRRHGCWPDDSVAIDLAESAEAIWSGIIAALGPTTPTTTGAVVEHDDATRPRWYPLVDPALCVNCHHCLQFCLFGVYSRDDSGQVVASQPDRCKAGCPACSRICPQGAIIFPLYTKDPAIAGAPGTKMHLDAAGKALFFNRTGQACPVCGMTAKSDPGRDGPLCAGCGRHTRPAQERKADAIDSLLDDLDRMQKRRGS